MPDSNNPCTCNTDHHKERVAILETELKSLAAMCNSRDAALRRELSVAANSEDRAKQAAFVSLERRLDSMNEWGATFRDMRDSYVEKSLWSTEQKVIRNDIDSILTRLSSMDRELALHAGAASEHKSIQVRTIMIMGIAITVINIIIDYILRSTHFISQ